MGSGFPGLASPWAACTSQLVVSAGDRRWLAVPGIRPRTRPPPCLSSVAVVLQGAAVAAFEVDSL